MQSTLSRFSWSFNLEAIFIRTLSSSLRIISSENVAICAQTPSTSSCVYCMRCQSCKMHWNCVQIRVRPMLCWHPIPDTIGRSCTDTDTDTRNDITHSLRQTYVTYIAHSVRTFQNITSLTSWTAAYLLLSAALQERISYNETTIGLKL